MNEKEIGLDGKEVLHCIQCNMSYGYWQIHKTDICLGCNEPLIYLEENTIGKKKEGGK